MAAATLFVRVRRMHEDGTIVEIKIWRLPEPSDERPHGLKYSLFYGRPGARVIGYDNEAGKGDHRHVRGREEAYAFVDVERLILHFEADVRAERGEA